MPDKLKADVNGTSGVDLRKANQLPQERMVAAGADSPSTERLFQREDFIKALGKTSRPKSSPHGKGKTETSG